MTATMPWPPADVVTRRPARRHGAWLAAGLILAVALIGTGGLDLVGLLSHEPLQRHHVWRGVVTSVDLAIGTGSVTVTGTDRPGVRVDATGARGLNAPSDHETVADGRLSITSSCSFVLIANTWCALSYRLQVPKGVSVTVSAGSGSIDVDGVSGPLTLSSSDGTVRVDGASGPLNLYSGDGDVEVIGARSQRVEAGSGDGAVTVGLATIPTEVSAHSGDGGVLVEVPPGPALYQVDAHSGDGHVATSVRTAPTSSHHIDAGSGDGDVTVRYLKGRSGSG
jgi:DUF4097 and DUF4098 domain-containing protein YvlB